MRIKSLQITGFKSFVDRTAFSFDYGISGIVGPNGCGKSNVVDAIRWAMGEQSPRRLRGKGMDDVIFAGSEARAPVGLAEVVLTFDNSDGLAPPDFAAYAEIEVARRLYKDGESEYLLNQTPCRLRDVLDFFRDTGIGTKGYTIVEQGRIAEIVSAKPEERRTLIEEAAGISKFRARRREAENKLAATEQNLVRVSDVLGEIRRQISSIERQAKRAVQHKRLREQQRVLDLSLSADERAALLGTLEARRAQLTEQQGAVAAGEAQCAEHDAQLARLRLELGERERAVQQSNESLFQLRSVIKELEQRIGFAGRERANLLEARAQHKEALEKLQAQLRAAEQAEARARDELAGVARALGEAEAATHAAETAEREAEQAHAALERERDDAQRALTEATANIARAEDRLAGTGARREELARKLRSADEQLELRLSEGAEAAAEQEDIEQGLRSLLEERERLMGLMRDAIARHAQAAEAARAAGETLRAERERAEARRARLESLGEVLSRAEDVSAGARHLQSLPDAERARLGLRGLLRDALDVDADCERAVEAVLAERAEGVLLTADADPLQVLEVLRAAQAGRGVLITHTAAPSRAGDTGAGDATSGAGDAGAGERTDAGDAAARTAGDATTGARDAHDANAAAASSPLNSMGVALATKVRFRAGFEDAGRALFADVRLVDGLAEVLAARAHPRRCTFVTRAGEVLTPDGALRGGGDATQAGVFSRAREVRELEAQVAGAADALAELETAHAASEAQLAQAVSELDNLRSRHHTAALAVAGREKDLERTRERVKTLDEAQQGRAAERSEFLTAAEDADAERARVTAELASARAAQGEQERALSQLGLKLAAAAREHARLAAEVSAQRVQHAAREELRARLAAEQERAQKSVAETRVWIQQRESEIASGEAREVELQNEVSSAEAALTERLREEERAGQSTNEKRDAYEAQGQAVRALEETARASQRTLETRRDAQRESESAAREAELRVEHLDEQIRDRWNVELASWTPPVFDDADAATSATKAQRARATTEADAETDAPANESAPDADAPPDADATTSALPQSASAAEREARRDARELAQLATLDADERRARLEQIRKRIESIGEVNLAAIEEHEELRERSRYLTEQKDDLDSSVRQLRDSIARINRTSRQRFRETFEQVKARFEQNFPRLFQGGRASLALTESEDVLEAGIEIMAQPPGKRLQSVNLLSGGEKTMTAIALLVSVFQVRPSPFFLLDEVDAALDDANVDRFNEIVREMAGDSQFLLITHNKRTIEIADVLYGVTMEEKGVSKLVAVDLHA